MFSRLEPILTPVVRRTESTDTRMDIRRDESKNFGRDKGGQGADDYVPIEWEDMASVSTGALRIFLQTLLQGPVAQETGSSLPAEEPRTSPTTLGARATSAYKTMGRAGHDRNVVTETSPSLPVVDSAAEHPETTVLGHEFSDADIRRVQFFIGELIELERRGVTELTIQRSLAFLDSLEQAIADGKASLTGDGTV